MERHTHPDIVNCDDIHPHLMRFVLKLALVILPIYKTEIS